MTDLNTKQKILNASIRLFNENGMANVRLQQIANDIGISPGNLAYHFRNKEALVQAIQENVEEEAQKILATYRLFPNLIDFDNQLSQYFNFSIKYPFFYLDLLEIDRHYPDIRSKREQHINKMISQIRKRFDFNHQRGLLIDEPQQGTYDMVSDTIWILITFWAPQNMVRSNDQSLKVNQFKSYIWNQIQPYFTAKGRSEFAQLINPLLGQHH